MSQKKYVYFFGEGKAEGIMRIIQIFLFACLCIGLAQVSACIKTKRMQENTSVPPKQLMARSSATSVEKLALMTEDGLKLTFADNGAIVSIIIDDKPVPLLGSARLGGLWIQEFNGKLRPVEGTVKQTADGLEQEEIHKETGLRTVATFKVQRNAIWCDGEIEDMKGEERALDVIFSLPVEATGWRWGESIRAEKRLDANTTSKTEDYPFSSLVSTEQEIGLAMGIPVDYPCIFSLFYNKNIGFGARVKLGLSAYAGGSLKSRAMFGFVLYRCDARWGFRDAARLYYKLFPKAFAKRVEHEGLWMFGRKENLLDPEHYAFAEAGPAGWQLDDKYGIYTCPYIIPGQREIMQLPKLPASYKEAMQVFEAFQPSSDEQKQNSGWGSNIKTIIENCSLRGPDDQWLMQIRNTHWGGNSITFPLNANPRLYYNKDKSTISSVLFQYVKDMLDKYPSVDGIYVDSLGSWGEYLNYRREHFQYAQIPLTYDITTGRPVIHNKFALLEFLWGLRDILEPRGKILFANGIHPARTFHAFACDVLGVEGSERLEHKRTIAYQKPFLLQIYNIYHDLGEVERYLKLCTFYGIYPSFGNLQQIDDESYARLVPLYSKYVPILRRITAAGWEPVTYAISSEPTVWIERFGSSPKEELLFTLYNSSKQLVTTLISLDKTIVPSSSTNITLVDLLTQEEWNVKSLSENLVTSVDMNAGETRVMHVILRN